MVLVLCGCRLVPFLCVFYACGLRFFWFEVLMCSVDPVRCVVVRYQQLLCDGDGRPCPGGEESEDAFHDVGSV